MLYATVSACVLIFWPFYRIERTIYSTTRISYSMHTWNACNHTQIDFPTVAVCACIAKHGSFIFSRAGTVSRFYCVLQRLRLSGVVSAPATNTVGGEYSTRYNSEQIYTGSLLCTLMRHLPFAAFAPTSSTGTGTVVYSLILL